MNMKALHLVSIFLFMSFILKAQNQPTFGELKAENETYFAGLENKYEKGSGFKQYERWKYFWEQRISDSDTVPSMAWRFYHNLEELRKLNMPTAFEQNRSLSKTEAAFGEWVSIGSDSSPGGYQGTGRLASIGFDPTDKNTFYVGAPSGGVWKTTDFGQTWTPKSDFLPQIGIGAIVVDPNNADIIYIGTGDMDGRDANSIGVLKSYDGGDTWNMTGLVFAQSDYQQISRLEMDPFNTNTLLASTADGIYRSTDSAHTWTEVQTGSNWNDLSFSPTIPGVAFAARRASGECYMYKSVDYGQTWNQVYTFSNARRVNFSLSPQQAEMIQVVAANYDNALLGMYRSLDTGTTFQKYYDPLSNGVNLLSYEPNGTNLTSGQGWYDLFVKVDPTDSLHFTVGGINIWDTYDGGTNWSISTHWYGAQNIHEVHADQHYSTYHPLDPSINFVLNDGGIYYRDLDSTYDQFIDITNGLSINQIYKLATARDTVDHILTGLQDNGSKLLENGNWRRATGGDGGECAIDPVNDNFMYAEYVYGVVYRSADKFDQNRITISNNLPNPGTGAWITPFELYEASPNEILIGYDEIFYSGNRGDVFAQISFFGNADNMRSIATTVAHSETIFATDYSNIYYTYDRFTGNWSSIGPQNNKGLPLQDLNCTMVEVSPTSAARIVATFSGYQAGDKVYTSLDSGNTWTNISSGIPNVPVLCVAMDNKPNNGIYVGCDVGVFYKNDLMTSFVPYFDSLPYAPVTKIVFNPMQQSIFASTYGRGVWKTNEVDSSDYLHITLAGLACENVDTRVISSGLKNPQNYTYTWYLNGQAQTASANELLISNLATGDSIYCEATDGTNSYTSNGVVINMLPNPTPVITWNSAQTVIVSSASQGNQWYANNQSIFGEDGIALFVDSKNLYGDFTVRVTQNNGCLSAYSNTLSRYPASIDEPEEEEIWATVHPNQSSDFITLELEDLKDNAILRILDIQGKLIRERKISDARTRISLKDLSRGMYILNIQNDQRESSIKVEKID